MSDKNALYAKELLKKLTLREKVAQLSQTVSGYRGFKRSGESFTFLPAFYDFISQYGAMGAISNIIRADNFAIKEWSDGIEPRHRVKVANQLQKEVLERARIPIPVFIEVEANHGVMALGSETFPTNLGMGCAFNDELYGRIMKTVGEEIALSGNHIALTTMLDMARDPRWGRTEEFFSEDPYLAARYAEKGVSEFKKSRSLICCKHFCATGDGYGGLNTAEVNVGERELHDIHLPAAAKAINAGADLIMAAYNTVDGIPCHVNRYVLQDVLRKELGFKGIVLSDGWGVERAIAQMGYDGEKGATEVLKAGVDLSLADHGAFLNLISACEKELVDESLIDAAVLRILEKKYECGLFDQPFKEENDSLTAFIGSGEQKRLSYEAASESIVLLKNNGILPLDSKKRVALFGQHAENIYYLLGDYTPLQDTTAHDTILDAFKKGFGSVSYTHGWDFSGDCSDIENAVSLAKQCDVAIVTVGGSSARPLASAVLDPKTGAAMNSKGFLDCGEGCDVADIALPGSQTQLIRRLKQEGIAVVALMIAGRPYQITEANELADAVLSAWYPGHQGASAIYDVITGKVNPSGKLSVSIPYASTCLPAYYNRYEKTVDNPVRRAYNGTYYDHLVPVLYPFGYGLSYSTFAYSDLKVTETAKNRFNVSVTVENVSEIGGKEVVQLYIRGSGNSVRRRAKELRGYKKIYLAPRQRAEVTFTLGYDELKVYSVNKIYEVEDATVTVMVGSNPNLPLSAEIKTSAEQIPTSI